MEDGGWSARSGDRAYSAALFIDRERLWGFWDSWNSSLRFGEFWKIVSRVTSAATRLMGGMAADWDVRAPGWVVGVFWASELNLDIFGLTKLDIEADLPCFWLPDRKWYDSCGMARRSSLIWDTWDSRRWRLRLC